MEEAYKGGYRREGGGRDHSRNSAGPYERPHRPRESRSRRLEDVYASDELLSATEFSRLDSESGVDYAEYLKRHRRMALERYFFRHKEEAWFNEQYDPFSADLYNTKLKEEAKIRMEKFKQLLLDGSLNETCLEDGEDLNVEADKATSLDGCKSFPASMNLPVRLQECLLREKYNNQQHLVSLSNISPSISNAELEKILQECSQDKLLSLEVSEPMKEKSNYRLGWAIFDESCELATVLSSIEERILHGDKIYCSAQKTFTLSIKIMDSSSFGTDERISKDLESARDLMNLVNVQMGLDTSFLDEKLASLSDKQKLDIIIVYLRKVHFICYYSCVKGNSANDLVRQTADIIIRGSDSKIPVDLSTFDAQLTEFIGKISAHYELFTEDNLLEKYVARVDEGRFRCTLCSKLFKGPDFVIKHLRLKHEDIAKTITMNTATLNAFIHRPPLSALLSSSSTSSQRRSSNSSIDRSLRDGGRFGAGRGGNFDRNRRRSPPPPPKDAVHDPRPIRQYVDWDAPVVGDVEISYD